jgi:uracil-DNA glycosylase
MLGYHPRFLAWNSLPLHPHLPEKPLTNRKPARDEIHQTEATLAMLIALLRPQEVIAVGATAAATTRRLGFTPFQVRHPGHGGSAAFQAGVEGVFGRQTRRAVIAKPERMNNRL